MDLIFTTQPLDMINNNDTTNITLDTLPQLFEGYSSGLLGFATVACIVFMLVGIPGNLITIIALARCKKVRNATAVFIINLSLSDLLFCCFNLPLAASTFLNKSWTHGDLLCRLFPMLRYGLLAVSLFTVLAITINRYVMIGHPRIYPRVYRHHYLGVMVILTWICAFGTLVPTWRGKWGKFGLDRNVGSCTILPDENLHSPKEFLFIMAFGLPCLFIIICYARIFYIVRKTAMRTHDPILSSMNSLKIPNKKQQKQQLKKDQDLIEKQRKEKLEEEKRIFAEEQMKNDLKTTFIERTENNVEEMMNDENEKKVLNENLMGTIKQLNNQNLIENGKIIDMTDTNSTNQQINNNCTNNLNLDQTSEISIPNSHNNSFLYRPVQPQQQQQQQQKHQQQQTPKQQHHRPYLSKYDELKYIDTSIDSDNLILPQQINNNICLTPPITILSDDMKPFNDNKCNISTTSINKSVEFSNENDYEINNEKQQRYNNNYSHHATTQTPIKIKSNMKKSKNIEQTQQINYQQQQQQQQRNNEVDSAYEISTTSSSDNNQQITNTNIKYNYGNQLNPVHIDPSSSSGIDLVPDDNNITPNREKKSFTIGPSLRRSQRFKNKKKDNSDNIIRKLSTAASGASILYPGNLSRKDRRLLKMILVIFTSFLICYLPITLTKIVRGVTNINFINIMGYVLIYLTTCINPIIYVVMSSEYRQAYKNLLMCRTNQQQRRNNIIIKGNSNRT